MLPTPPAAPQSLPAPVAQENEPPHVMHHHRRKGRKFVETTAMTASTPPPSFTATPRARVTEVAARAAAARTAAADAAVSPTGQAISASASSRFETPQHKTYMNETSKILSKNLNV